MSQKTIILIAGPNGAGKTTFAREYLPQEADCLTFINADLIAQGLSPFRAEEQSIRAARLMLEMIDECLKRGESFSIETTLSGRTYARMIPQWKLAGYEVVLFFLRLPNEDLAIRRVAERVAQGGHNIPESVIRRRSHAGLDNFMSLYKPLVDTWRMYDNSSEAPFLINSSDES